MHQSRFLNDYWLLINLNLNVKCRLWALPLQITYNIYYTVHIMLKVGYRIKLLVQMYEPNLMNANTEKNLFKEISHLNTNKNKNNCVTMCPQTYKTYTILLHLWLMHVIGSFGWSPITLKITWSVHLEFIWFYSPFETLKCKPVTYMLKYLFKFLNIF